MLRFAAVVLFVLLAGEAAAVVPVQEPLLDAVEIIEVNHFYDGEGKPIFDQVIFWDFFEDRFHVTAWRLLKVPDQIPVARHGGWASTWFDGVAFRQVQSRTYIETWTQYDPESLDREQLPPTRRRGLAGELPMVMPVCQDVGAVVK